MPLYPTILLSNEVKELLTMSPLSSSSHLFMHSKDDIIKRRLSVLKEEFNINFNSTGK